FQAIEKRPLTGENLFSRDGNNEPRRAIDLGNMHGTATSRGPFNAAIVAVPGSSLNSRRAAASASSPSSSSPFGIDQAPRSRLRQKGPPGWTSRTSMPASPLRYIRIPALMVAMLTAQDAG